MKLSLKHVLITLLLLLVTGGVFITVLASHSFYQLSLERFHEEKRADLELISKTITSPYWIHQETTFFSGITEFFIREVAHSPDTTFIRIVSTDGGIIASSNLDDRNKTIEPPPNQTREISVRTGVFEGHPIQELSKQISDDRLLWMGITTERVTREILVTSLLMGIGIMVFFLFIGFVVFYLVRKFFSTPLVKLRDSFEQLGKENYTVRLHNGTLSEINQVFETFNVMAVRLGKIHERERLIAESKSQFIDIAAHQLRTPTSTFRWLFSTLANEEAGKLTKKQKQLIERASETNNNFIKLIDDLLNTNRIEQGNIQYTFNDEDLVRLISESVEELTPLAKEKQLAITFSKPAKAVPRLKLDRHLMKIAIQNVIENAIRYSKREGTVEINLKKGKGVVCITIQDSGVGIPDVEQQRIFEKFFRATNATAMHTEGTGLGLYLVKSIVSQHRGKVSFASSEGKGTKFTIELPMSKEKPSAD